jgi:hypothetical protein
MAAFLLKAEHGAAYVPASLRTSRARTRSPSGSSSLRRKASPEDAAMASTAQTVPFAATRWRCSCSRPSTDRTTSPPAA